MLVRCSRAVLQRKVTRLKEKSGFSSSLPPAWLDTCVVGALQVFDLVVRCSLTDCPLPPGRCMSPSGGSRRCSILRKFQWPRHVRFGSKADMVVSNLDVRFTPKSRRSRLSLECLLWPQADLATAPLLTSVFGGSQPDLLCASSIARPWRAVACPRLGGISVDHAFAPASRKAASPASDTSTHFASGEASAA